MFTLPVSIPFSSTCCVTLSYKSHNVAHGFELFSELSLVPLRFCLIPCQIGLGLGSYRFIQSYIASCCVTNANTFMFGRLIMWLY